MIHKITVYLLIALFCNTTNANEIQHKIDHLLQPVVKVEYEANSGSGVVICVRKEDIGYRNFIITNFHIINSAIQITEEEEEERGVIAVNSYTYEDHGKKTVERTSQANIIAHSKELDLALLEVIDKSIKLCSISLLPKHEKLNLFQQIWNVGFPGNRDIVFVDGIINGFNKGSVNDIGFLSSYIQTSAPIWFGSSGGLASVKINNKYYLAAIPALVDTSIKGAPYVNWGIDTNSIRIFLQINDLGFVENDKIKIPKFKVYPKPEKINIKIDFFFIPIGEE
jgi:hypothetical protein